MPSVSQFSREAVSAKSLAAVDSGSHIKSLDGLRGIAILLVFVFHYVPRNFQNPLEFVASLGWSGVDLFFVLSGFLITGILYDSRNAGGYFKAFYMRRVLRLFPVYCLAIIVLIVGSGFLAGARSWLWVPFFFYGANIVLAIPHPPMYSLPYFACSHFWSLALEEQFYSIWPFVVFFVPRRRVLMLICSAGIATAIAVRVGLAVAHAHPWLAFAELPARMDSLLAGALLALGVRGPAHDKWLNPIRLRWILAAGCCVLALLIWYSRSVSFIVISMSTVGFSVIAAMGAGALGLALIPHTLTNQLGSLWILRFFGRYSYGLYVWHLLPSPMLESWTIPGTRYIHSLFLAEVFRTLVLLAIFTAVSVLSYHLVEVRFLRLKSKFVATRPEHVRA